MLFLKTSFGGLTLSVIVLQKNNNNWSVCLLYRQTHNQIMWPLASSIITDANKKEADPYASLMKPFGGRLGSLLNVFKRSP